MRQRIFFRTLLGAQFLVALFLFGSAVYLTWLSRTSEIVNDPDGPAAVHGIRVATIACLVLCIPWALSFFGLLRRQPWGWWLGLVANSLVCAVVSWALIFDEPRPDSEDYLVPAVFLLLTVLQLLTRPTTWKQTPESTIASETQQSAGSGI